MLRIKAIATHPQMLFLVLNVLVNLLFLLRAYVAMQVLDFRELGLLAIAQSAILLVGIMHLGILNGGYRLLCSAKDEGERQEITNGFYSAFMILALLALIAGAIAALQFDATQYKITALVGAVGGIAALMRTWMMNQLLASSDLATHNRLNVYSAVCSLSFLALIPYDPLLACMLAMMMQHVLFVVFAGTLSDIVLPRRIVFSAPLIKRMLSVGFVLFLTGVFLQLNIQIERWYVATFLGLEELGHLYLAILFLTLFQLVPNSLNAIFFPPLVRAHDANDEAQTRKELGRLVWATIAYVLLVIALVAFVAEPLLSIFLPKQAADLQYIEWLLPGLVLFTIASAFAATFNVLVQYLFYIIGYLLGTISLVSLLGFLLTADYQIGLGEVVAIRSLSYAATGVALLIGYAILVRRNPQFKIGWVV